MIDAEVIENNTEIVRIKQKPIIEYELIEAKGKEVEQKIKSLDIDNIVPNEDNLRVIKKTRAELNKEFKELEEQRKIIKDIVMKPYNDFEAKYREHIQKHYKDADLALKEKAFSVDAEILKQKEEKLIDYFNEINNFDFISYEDLGFKIKKSDSDKKLREQVEEFLLQVQQDLATIKTLTNKDRVLAKYYLVKDLNRAISEVNIEINKEKEIREKSENNQDDISSKEDNTANSDADKLFVVKFKVVATIKDIKELKEFMNKKGVNYEAI